VTRKNVALRANQEVIGRTRELKKDADKAGLCLGKADRSVLAMNSPVTERAAAERAARAELAVKRAAAEQAERTELAAAEQAVTERAAAEQAERTELAAADRAAADQAENTELAAAEQSALVWNGVVQSGPHKGQLSDPAHFPKTDPASGWYTPANTNSSPTNGTGSSVDTPWYNNPRIIVPIVLLVAAVLISVVVFWPFIVAAAEVLGSDLITLVGRVVGRSTVPVPVGGGFTTGAAETTTAETNIFGVNEAKVVQQGVDEANQENAVELAKRFYASIRENWKLFLERIRSWRGK